MLDSSSKRDEDLGADQPPWVYVTNAYKVARSARSHEPPPQWVV